METAQSSGGKLAHKSKPDRPEQIQAPRERVRMGTARAAEIIARTVGSLRFVSRVVIVTMAGSPILGAIHPTE